MTPTRNLDHTLRQSACAAVLIVAIATGCHRTNVAPAERASRVSVSSCPPDVEAANRDSAPPLATLSVTLTINPPLADSSLITVRMDGETMRNVIRVNPAKPFGFTLVKGVYVVRITESGYTGVEGRVRLTAGCEATMTMQLKKDGTR